MKRIIGVASVALVAAIALAATVIVGAKGQGGAVNAAGKRAEFNIDAHKARNGEGHVRVGGFARFIAIGGTSARPETNGINIPEVRTLAKNGNVCQFGGPAWMQIRVGHEYHTVRGACTMNVVDQHNPEHHTGEPDLIRVRFVEAGNNRVFEWAGKVNRGDIAVYERVVD
jgi:hypothetical protein